MIRIAKQVKNSTIYHKYLSLPDDLQQNESLVEALKTLDVNANINWQLMHMGSAHRYLRRESGDIEATGGTNWKEYLPPSFQKIIFFPELYSEKELNNWGKRWVDHMLNPDKSKME